MAAVVKKTKATIKKKWTTFQDLKKLVGCIMEVDLIEAEVKALKEGLISKKVFDNLMSLKSKVPIAERYTTLLRHVHETLQERLSILDTLATATQAVAEGLIKKDILVSIASLNKNVPDSLKARYLLLFLQPALQCKLEQFRSHVMTMRFEFTSYEDVRIKLREYIMSGLICESVLTPLYPKQKDEEICHQKDKAITETKDKEICLLGKVIKEIDRQKDEEIFPQKEKVIELLKKEKDRLNHALKPFSKIALSSLYPFQSEATAALGPQHLSKLIELLAGYSFNWKNIGIALNFQPQDLQTIEATPLLIPGAPKSYLIRLLEDWLQMTLRHTLPPTVKNLEKALNSQTVGLGTLGSEVQAIVGESTHLLNDYNQSYSSTKVWFDTKEPSVYPKHNEIYIEEGDSTLLEIEVISAGKKTPAYKWLIRGEEYGSEPILYLSKADIDWDDDCVLCEVKTSSTSSCSVVTVPITMHVSCPLDEFTPSLSSMYLRRPEVPEDTWPPSGSQKFINLAIVKQQKINYGSEHVRFTIRGDIDDILQDKEAIDYAEIYGSLKSENQVMFIEGRPGSGKTTFVHKITRDWASDFSRRIRILLLVSLRVLNTIRNPSLSDILHLFRDLKVTPEIIEKRDGKGVCFIFDGLDEFSPSDGKNSIVYKIIDKAYLHQSTVVVASRPAALAELRKKASKNIEVLGFMSNQIQEYFDCYPFSDATKNAKIRAYLSLHPNICHMCYLPIHATVVGFLFEVTGQVPKTETKMYEHFTRFTLLRNISKNQDIQLNSEDDIHQCLNKEEKGNFKQICRLALDKTLLNKQVLYQKEISSFFQATNISLGLICIDRTADLYSFKNVYTFLHLTFQEYLAAYHISTLSDEEQMKLIEEHGHKNHLLVVWKFFCGLVDIRPFDNKFKTLLHKTQGNTLYHFQCAYESQQQIVCAQLLKAVHYNIQVGNIFLSIPDFTAIGYVTNKAILPTKLSLRNCDVDIVGIDALISEMENTSKHSIECLHIVDKSLNCELITRLLANFQALKSLSLVKATQQEDNLSQQFLKPVPQPAPMDFLVLKKIQTLTINSFQDESREFQMMVFALRQCENLAELNLTHNKIGKFGAKYLSQNLPHCRSLKIMDISNNGMSSDQVVNVLHSMKQLKIKSIKGVVSQGGYDAVSTSQLLESLKHFTTLQSLATQIVLEDKHVDIFVQDSKEWKDLKELNIVSQPSYEQRVSMAILSGFQLYFHKIEVLVMKYSIYNIEGTKKLTAGLQQCRNLRVLDLSDNTITKEQLKFLLSVDFSRLEELYLANICFRNDEVVLFSSYLQHFHSLQHLWLNCNHFTRSGAMALATELHHCTKLMKLDLRDNIICNDAARAIAVGLRLCTNFQSLCISRKHCEHFARAYELEDKEKRKRIFGCDTIKFV